MLEIAHEFVDIAIDYMQLYGPWLGFLIIILESILPWLPLCVFIALNMASFGNIFGFFLSWVATIVGCLLSYWFFKYLVGNRIDKYINDKKHEKLKKVIKTIRNINFSTLVILVALPFSPAFLINIACGITKVNFKKFIFSLFIGKVVIVYFWGFVGTSLIDSITNIGNIIQVLILLLFAFIISKIVMKKYNIE